MLKIIIISLIILLLSLTSFAEQQKESICYGTPGNGRLENGVRLPRQGKNFVPYSAIGVMIGRTYVHSKVRSVVAETYRTLEKSHPNTIFMYGETGLKNGGRFRPHKTHQNGLSVDFMVPVLDRTHTSVPLPTSIFNKFGYAIEFDKTGNYNGYHIDFEAMAAHLKALHKKAEEVGIGISRVIFDPGLQPLLFQTKSGRYLKANLVFSKKRSWVRHDEHYHVDFKIRCREM